MSGSGASTGVDREVAELGELLPQVEIKTATGSFVSASYIRTPTAAVKGTLTLPDGYPTRPLIVAVQASDVVPPGLKRKLEKDLGKVAAASAGEGHLCAVLRSLVDFIDTNRFVPCWRELKQSVEHVASEGGKVLVLSEAKGKLRVMLQSGSYFYKCSIAVDAGYPSTMTHEDWGKVCVLRMEETNFPPKIEQLITLQGRDLVRRMQDGIPEGNALKAGNPVQLPKAEAGRTEVEADVRGGTGRRANVKTEKKSQWDLEEEARMAQYSMHDGSEPKPSLLPLVKFLARSVKGVAEAKCPECGTPTLPSDPDELKNLYLNPSSVKNEREKEKRRNAKRLRPVRPHCGCWYHFECIDKVIREPPFGAECGAGGCGGRVWHGDWPSDVRELERAWTLKQARNREVEDAALFF